MEFANFHWQFIQNLLNIIKPLTNLTKNKFKGNLFF
jgi:hypothetical protein